MQISRDELHSDHPNGSPEELLAVMIKASKGFIKHEPLIMGPRFYVMPGLRVVIVLFLLVQPGSSQWPRLNIVTL